MNRCDFGALPTRRPPFDIPLTTGAESIDMSRYRSSAVCLAAALLLLASGCATPKWLNFSKSDLLVAGPDNPVVHILPMWQPASGTGIDKQPARGFAGQIYFFAGKDRLPAQVHGNIRIFEFDDQGNEQDRVKPIHQFDFPDAAWQMYLTDTKLGPCYTVFIPYVRKGFHEAQCTLRVRLTPESGPPIYSDMISIVLPGSKEGEKPASTESAAAATPTTAAAPRPLPTTPTATTPPAATNAVPPAAAPLAAAAGAAQAITEQQPRRLPLDQQQQMVREMAQYLQTAEALEDEQPPVRPKRVKSKKPPPKPPVDDEELDEVEVVEYVGEEPPPRARSRRKPSHRQHPLEVGERSQARRPSSAHPLELDDEQTEAPPQRQRLARVMVESSESTPVDRMPRSGSGKVRRTAARSVEPEDDADDVEVIEEGEEPDEEMTRERSAARAPRSRSSREWVEAPARRTSRQKVIQQASAEVEVEIAPQSDAVNPAPSSRRMQTYSIPLTPQTQAFVSH
jgi:hypothetical protein